ncbi:MAG: Hsp70 family protein, partial [Pedococcus sp.]
KQRREETEARNTAENLVYSTEKFLGDNADKLPADGRGDVDTALADLKEALKPESGASPEDISAKTSKLSEESQKLGAAMYAAAAESEQPGTAGDGAPSGDAGSADEAASDDDVVDAEVVEDDDTDGDKK